MTDPLTIGPTEALVVSVNRNSYMVEHSGKQYYAELSGRLMFSSDDPLDLPLVGDRVNVILQEDPGVSVIDGIFPRNSLIRRKASGQRIEYQGIAANINTAFLVMGLDNNFNLNRLERYMVLCREAGIDAVAVLTKVDLLSQEELALKTDEVRSQWPDLAVMTLDARDAASAEHLSPYMISGNIYCLLGSSGAGKSTLLNSLLGESVQKVNGTRQGDDRGRHTTTRRELFRRNDGVMLIDTPGMRELGNFGIDGGLQEQFQNIMDLAAGCRFSDCSHVHEEGCAVKKAVEDGILTEREYLNFLRLEKENAHYSTDYVQRRKKDKDFGKMVRSVKKDLKAIGKRGY